MSSSYIRPPNAPRPLWPWLVGATALAGGFAMFKKKNVAMHHRRNTVLPNKTKVEVTDK